MGSESSNLSLGWLVPVTSFSKLFLGPKNKLPELIRTIEAKAASGLFPAARKSGFQMHSLSGKPQGSFLYIHNLELGN